MRQTALLSQAAESVLEDVLLGDRTHPGMVQSVATEALRTERLAHRAQRRQADSPCIQRESRRVIERHVLQRLLQVLATRGEVLLFKDSMGALLRRAVVRKLLYTIQWARDRERRHVGCQPLHTVHRHLTADVGAEALLGLLIRASAEEEHRIDEREAALDREQDLAEMAAGSAFDLPAAF